MPVEKKNAKLRHWLVLLYSEHHSILLFLTKTSESRFVASEVFSFRLFFYSPFFNEINPLRGFVKCASRVKYACGV